MIKYHELENLLNGYTDNHSMVLEIGSRPGCYAFHKENVTHIESNIENLEGLNIINTGSCLPFKDNVFDMVFMVAVDYYVPDHEELIAECNRVLKKGGRIVIATYKKKNLLNQVATQEAALHAFGTNEYKRRFKNNGFQNIAVETIMNNPPQSILKSAVWHLLPRAIRMLRSQWKIYSGSKI